MINIEPIATVKSIFTENFGIPRQPGLCPSASAYLEFPNNEFYREALKDLDGSSHIWIIFYFHSLKKAPNKAKIRPPRLGGNKYVGVFSSRSPYRPNQIGLSLVEYKGLQQEKSAIKLHISNHDLLDGTPVLDIKPYIMNDMPESPPSSGWQSTPWNNLDVEFSVEAEEFLKTKKKFRQLITDILKNNPTPAYKSKQAIDKIFGMKIQDLNVKFRIQSNRCLVTEICP